MTREEAIETLRANYPDAYYDQLREAVDAAIEALKAQDAAGDTISRQAAIDVAKQHWYKPDIAKALEQLPSTQPETEKYEYHYDHTDCIWYRPEARNRCPVTCAQYRDGWNDAMNYIFRDGKGYRPYRRDKQYDG